MRSRAAPFLVVLVAMTSAALAQRHGAATPPSNASASPPATGATGASSAPDADASTAAGSSLTNSFAIPMAQRGTGAVAHYPIPEQLARNDVPIFAQVHSSAPIDHVSVFYRTAGSTSYRELRMSPMGQDLGLNGGFGAQIPCEDAFPPAIEYYVEADDTSGAAVGNAGTAVQPIRLPIVISRNYNIVPTLPGQHPPRSCGTMEATLSGAHGARDAGAAAPTSGTADLGEPCTHNNDCHTGLRCGSTHRCVFIHGQ